MAANSSNVDVILDTNNQIAPSCPHGPTLLFVRYGGQDSERRFFACSAFRNRKDCNFFQWEDEKISDEKQESRRQNQQSQLPKFSHLQFQERFQKFCKLEEHKRFLCQSCGLLLLPAEVTDHKDHNLTSPVTDVVLQKPTRLLTPIDNNKTYAQYLFAESAVDFTVKTLQNISTHILCIGAPRIFEAVRRKKKENMHCLLLDLDHRYQQFYSPDEFCRYNMFNHHFFDGQDSEDTFHRFLKEEGDKKVAIVMDPPFGGMVEALSAVICKINKKWKELSKELASEHLPVLWFFPYFMEKRVLEFNPNFHMLDYKVDYDNHSLFKRENKKHGSPVRIFTNLSPDRVVLPSQEGYRYCSICKRYSAKENLHCDVCDACMSKNGTTYRHCFKCDRCMKPSMKHCDTCKRCQLPQHNCDAVKSTGCHICGHLGHKRRDCPNKGSDIKNKTLNQTEKQASRKQRNKRKIISTETGSELRTKRKKSKT